MTDNRYMKAMSRAATSIVPVLAWLVFAVTAHAQSAGTVSLQGIVIDEAKLPVAGAALYVKGNPEKGNTITSPDGRFFLTVPKGSTVLIQCLGYTDGEYAADNSREGVVIAVRSTAIALDDVVFVAYGTQKKESVVGAISQIDGNSLADLGTNNITNALTGKISGMTVMQSSGQPGNNDATILVRGVSSWNGSAPLVMVDGIERPFNELSPEEIAAISVLKDASATAMFGAKGANGVILVTTKTGKEGKPKMQLSANYGIDVPTHLPEHVSSWETAEALNVAFRNSQSYTSQFSAKDIAEYRNPSSALNALRYPDYDWYDLTMKNLASTANASLSISGGTKKVKYYLSAGYIHEGSLFRNLSGVSKCDFTYDRINFRSNINAELTKYTDLAFKLGGYVGNQTAPTGASTTSLLRYIFSSSGMMYNPVWPAWVLEEIRDEHYPDASGERLGTKKGSIAYYDNAYRFLAGGGIRAGD